jgi:tRNA pseudouridine38-40 synthase
VEGTLEAAVAQLRGNVPTELTVAGRTDRGVHAWGQVVSHAGEPLELRGLNAVLPHDVAVLVSEPAPEGFDARRDAISRTYCYRIVSRRAPSVFEARRALHWPHPMDRERLAECAHELAGVHDFTAFTPTETDHVRFERVIYRSGWVDRGELLEFWITADSFMRHMNRALVGTMLEVAQGRRTLRSFRELLAGAPRPAAGPTAPPHGLYFATADFHLPA